MIFTFLLHIMQSHTAPLITVARNLWILVAAMFLKSAGYNFSCFLLLAFAGVRLLHGHDDYMNGVIETAYGKAFNVFAAMVKDVRAIQTKQSRSMARMHVKFNKALKALAKATAIAKAKPRGKPRVLIIRQVHVVQVVKTATHPRDDVLSRAEPVLPPPSTSVGCQTEVAVLPPPTSVACQTEELVVLPVPSTSIGCQTEAMPVLPAPSTSVACQTEAVVLPTLTSVACQTEEAMPTSPNLRMSNVLCTYEVAPVKVCGCR
jgi:hypothetical protein